MRWLTTKPTEHQEQAALYEWAALHRHQYPQLKKLYAIPNGGLRDAGTARKLKREGVKAGVADCFLSVARGRFHGLYVEMKTKDGRLSKEQRAFAHDVLTEGYHYVVCRSWEEAAKEIVDYLMLKLKEDRPWEQERRLGIGNGVNGTVVTTTMTTNQP